jgi:hypothetical protein
VIHVGNCSNRNANENQCRTFVDPFHRNDPLVIYRYIAKLFYNRPGWEEVRDSPEHQQE